MEIVYQNAPWLGDLVEVADPIKDFFRRFGWGFLKCLAKLIDVLYDAVNGLLGINIMQIDSVQEIVNKISPVGWSVLTISLAAVGIFIMLYPSKKKGEIARGFLLSVVLMISVPFMFTGLNQLKDASVIDLGNSINANGNAGQEILKNMVYDVEGSVNSEMMIDHSTDPYYLDINQRASKDNSVLQYKIDTKKNGILYGEELSSGFFGWGEERIYAYKYLFIEPLFILSVMMICLLFTGFKLGRLIFELVVHQAIAPIVFASDVTGSGRSKKFIQSLISTYLVLIMILLTLKIYISVTTWATLNISSIWVRILFIAGASWGVIDGPDIVLKLLGVDAGVRSAAAAVMTISGVASGAAKLATGGWKTADKTVKAVTRAPQNVASGIGSMVGRVSGMRNIGENVSLGRGVGSMSADEQKLNGISNMADMNKILGQDHMNNSGYRNTPDMQKKNSVKEDPSKGFMERLSESYQNNRDTKEGKITRNAADIGYVVGKITKPQDVTPNYKPPKEGK